MMSEITKSQSSPRLLATVVVMLAIAISGCARDAPKSGDTLPASDIDEKSLPGLAHIHGLGINPGDGALYVATHFGLWTVSDGRAKRVGDAAHDFMGFSVAGEDRFIASGHPQGAPDLPPHLGLIESTDAGTSWKSRSLMGKADFHVLQMGAERVYGWSSTTGKLAVTDDLRRWSDRGSLNIVDLAIDPEDDEHVIAAVAVDDSAIELRESDDAGVTWSLLDGAPALLRVDWTDRWAWGVTSNGDVWRSKGADDDWKQVGDVGADVEAITADSKRWVVAADGAVRESRDDGASWSVIVDY
jgi:hypothetical protein